jgi:predicted nucleotidyltransferase
VKRKSPDIQQIEYSLRCALESEKNVATAYIFGSLGTPYFNADSDIDVALLFFPDRVPDVLEVLAIQEKLSTAARSEVDVVFLNQSSPVICMQVLRNGRKVIEPFPSGRQSPEMNSDKVKRWKERSEYDLETAEVMHAAGRYIYSVFMCPPAIGRA